MNDQHAAQLGRQMVALREDLSDQILKLYQHMELRFAVIEAKLDEKASIEQLDRVLNALDGIAKQQEICTQERLAANRQLDRHESWLHQLAKKTNTRLNYG